MLKKPAGPREKIISLHQVNRTHNWRSDSYWLYRQMYIQLSCDQDQASLDYLLVQYIIQIVFNFLISLFDKKHAAYLYSWLLREKQTLTGFVSYQLTNRTHEDVISRLNIKNCYADKICLQNNATKVDIIWKKSIRKQNSRKLSSSNEILHIYRLLRNTNVWSVWLSQ